jgi:hypothetical protein
MEKLTVVGAAGTRLEVEAPDPATLTFKVDSNAANGEDGLVTLDREGTVLLERFLAKWLGVTR